MMKKCSNFRLVVHIDLPFTGLFAYEKDKYSISPNGMGNQLSDTGNMHFLV